MRPNRVYANREISKIMNISPRRIIGLTEKGIVSPLRESAGAGYKRLYDYESLMELSLYKRLLLLGQGIISIKKLLDELRSKELIKQWTRKFHWHESKYIQRKYTEYLEKNQTISRFKPLSFDDWFKRLEPEEKDDIIYLLPERDRSVNGYLNCYLDGSGKWSCFISRNPSRLNTKEEHLADRKSIFSIGTNLFEIKNDIDQRISTYEEEKIL